MTFTHYEPFATYMPQVSWAAGAFKRQTGTMPWWGQGVKDHRTSVGGVYPRRVRTPPGARPSAQVRASPGPRVSTCQHVSSTQTDIDRGLDDTKRGLVNAPADPGRTKRPPPPW